MLLITEEKKLFSQVRGEWYSQDENKIYCFMSAGNLAIQNGNGENAEIVKWKFADITEDGFIILIESEHELYYKVILYLEKEPYQMKILKPKASDIWLVKDGHILPYSL